MARRSGLFPFAALLALSPAASAAEITADGARDLAASLSTYVGREAVEEGIVTVVPRGESYKVTIDVQRLVGAMVEGTGSVVRLDGELSFETAPLDDGTWSMTWVGFPSVSAEYDLPQGRQSVDYRFGLGEVTGVFDPALAYFSRMERKGGEFHFTTTDGETAAFGSMTYDGETITATPAAGGSIDIVASSVIDTLKESATRGGTTIFTALADRIETEAAIDGLRSLGLRDLLAFAVARKAGERLDAAAGAELKDKIRAALPLFDQMDASGAISRLSVTTPAGPFSAGPISFSVATTGIAAEGRYELAFAAEKLVLPALPMPPWSAALLPEGFDLAVAVTGHDLAAPAAMVIDAMDPTKPEPVDEAVLAAAAERILDPAAGLTLTLAPSRLASPLYEARFEGAMSVVPAEPEPAVSGTATVSLSGLDEIMALMQDHAATDPQAAQAAMGLTFAKGLAQVEPDGTAVWEIAVAESGAVTVNGQIMVPARK